jgi:hypothetical protein
VADSSGQGGSGLTLERALAQALAMDQATQSEILSMQLGPPRTVFSELRAYLIRRADEIGVEENNPWTLLRYVPPDKGLCYIALGPSVDKGPTPSHFRFESGSRLSFGLTLAEEGRGSRLVSFRYHYQLPDGMVPAYLRFDLNKNLHDDPIKEPCCHLHPGLDEVRIPITLYEPFEILDRIFFSLEKYIKGTQ